MVWGDGIGLVWGFFVGYGRVGCQHGSTLVASYRPIYIESPWVDNYIIATDEIDPAVIHRYP